MRVFVTGASGFVGSATVKELLNAGHQVLGLVRSETGAAKVKDLGAEPLLGDVNDTAILQQGASGCDAVIHTAFNHDFSQFKANCEADRKVIEALGDALANTGKPLVITSGIGLLGDGRLVSEDEVLKVGSDVMPRAASEEAAAAATAKGADVYIVRLPPSVHGEGDHGFVPLLISLATEKALVAYIGDGNNRWPAVHRNDAAAAYRLIIEQRPQQKIFNPVAEGGIPFRSIAEAISRGTGLPVESKSGEEAVAYFGWFTHFAGLDCPASSEKTQNILGWTFKEQGLLEDMEASYFKK